MYVARETVSGHLRPWHPRRKTGNMAVGSLLAFLALARLSVACQDAGVSAIVLQIRPSMRSGSVCALVLHTGQAAGMKVVFWNGRSCNSDSCTQRSNERCCQASQCNAANASSFSGQKWGLFLALLKLDTIDEEWNGSFCLYPGDGNLSPSKHFFLSLAS